MTTHDAPHDAPLVRRALRDYGMEASTIEQYRSSNNRVFRVSTRDRRELAVRLHRPGGRTFEEIAQEIRFLEAVAAAGSVVAPVPLRTSSDDAVTTIIDGTLPVAVTVLTWVPGEVLRPGEGAGDAVVRRIGGSVALLHDVASAGCDTTTAPDITAPALVRPLLRHVNEPEHVSIIEAVLDVAHDTFDSVPPAEIGLIHHDIIFSNCVHRARTTAIIDFDDCGVAPYLQDLGAMLENIAGSRRARALRQSFVDGYTSVRPLPAHSDADLDAMVAVRLAWTTAWVYMRGATGDFARDRVQAIAQHHMTGARRILADL